MLISLSLYYSLLGLCLLFGHIVTLRVLKSTILDSEKEDRRVGIPILTHFFPPLNTFKS
jgi:hypothetical protein